ncbi:MAG: FAD-dependent monooxygenase, partial [Candidatus Binatia bacterium]
MADAAAPVLVVGSGPAGLTAVVLLADLGVPAVLVERNPSTTDHPRAHVVNTRTMEIFRRIGIAEGVHASGLTEDAYARILWKRSITGEEYGALAMTEARVAERRQASPTSIASCPQDAVERLLRVPAERRGCDLRYGTEVVGYEQDDEGVTVMVNGPRGYERLRASYV